MSDPAQTLIDDMVAAGGWPEPGLLQGILEQGEAAVPPLLEVVRREVTGWPQAETLRRACLLLGSLEATSAIPALIELFYRYHDYLLESETVQPWLPGASGGRRAGRRAMPKGAPGSGTSRRK